MSTEFVRGLFCDSLVFLPRLAFGLIQQAVVVKIVQGMKEGDRDRDYELTYAPWDLPF